MLCGRPIRFVAVCTLGLGAAACNFDPSGNGFPMGASVGESSGAEDDGAAEDAADDPADAPMTGTRGDMPDGDTGAGSGDAPDGDSSAGDGTTGASSSDLPDPADDGAGTSGVPGDPPPCPSPVFEVYWVEDADVAPPMQLVTADANDDPKVANSTVAELGSVTVQLEFACPGEYTLWGLVWDYEPGAWGEPDPDSFYFDVGGAESTWRYGCQTESAPSGLSWQRFAALAGQPCDASYVVLDVGEAGTVALTLRNREAGAGSQVAGIAAIAVSDDPGADPATLYAPY